MTKATHIKVGGSWKQVNNVWQRVSGEWKEEVMPNVRVSGSWKPCMEYGATWTWSFDDIVAAANNTTSQWDTGIRVVPSSSTLTFYWYPEPSTVDGWFEIYKNSNLVGSYYIPYNDGLFLTLGIEEDDEINIVIKRKVHTGVYYAIKGSLVLYHNNDNGNIVGTINIDVAYWEAGCYLTTACVQYKGLNDKGAELQAMRRLRDEYMIPNGCKHLIDDYYKHSPAIIKGINKEKEPAVFYEAIHGSVIMVQLLIAENKWESAMNEYLQMYLKLKDKFV